MAWHKKQRGAQGGYYYRSVRSGETVRKVYVGRGDAAQAAAVLVEQAKLARAADRAARRTELLRCAQADDLLRQLRTLVDLLAGATLLLAGNYKHHGQWRRRRQ